MYRSGAVVVLTVFIRFMNFFWFLRLSFGSYCRYDSDRASQVLHRSIFPLSVQGNLNEVNCVYTTQGVHNLADMAGLRLFLDVFITEKEVASYSWKSIIVKNLTIIMASDLLNCIYPKIISFRQYNIYGSKIDISTTTIATAAVIRAVNTTFDRFRRQSRIRKVLKIQKKYIIRRVDVS